MNNLLEVKVISKKKGKGIFAKEDIEKDVIIDVAHILLIPNKEWELIKDTVLSNYSFEWDDPTYIGKCESAVSLSVSQFINHSYNPNVRYTYDYKKKCISYITLREISKGEEITVNYNGNVDDKSPMWFKVVD
jgi:SET domain-containing protein